MVLRMAASSALSFVMRLERPTDVAMVATRRIPTSTSAKRTRKGLIYISFWFFMLASKAAKVVRDLRSGRTTCTAT